MAPILTTGAGVFRASGGGGWAGPTTSLTHRWPLDSLTITDAVGSVNGTAGGGCSLATGPSGSSNTSIAFDGTNPAIALASDPQSASPWTLAFWVYFSSYNSNDGGDGRIVCFGSTPSLVASMSFGTGDVAIEGGGTSGIHLNTAAGLTTWMHFIFSWDGASLTMYKDNSSTGTAGGFGNGATAGVYALGERDGTTRLWQGRMAQVCWYNKVLDGTERTQLFNAF